MAPRPSLETSTRHVPRIVAWEITRSCPLACKHCRASARREPYRDELSTDEAVRVLDGIASFARPLVILTGGEPMLRPDVFDLAERARDHGLPVAMAPCGMLIDDEAARRMKAVGFRQISISLDGATPSSHDAFRGVEGAFEGSLRGIEALRRAGVPFQINTTVTEMNLGELEEVLDLAVRLGATCFNAFLLVPTGRGALLADRELSPAQYETALEWLAGQESREDIRIRVTCAPHYQRILREKRVRKPSGDDVPGGCLGGKSFAFISHTGKVQICGFLDVECGDLRREDYDFRRIWETSEVLRAVREPDGYGGRCGVCEYRFVCGGCRARAFAATGDYLAEEPFCVYQPRRGRKQLSED